MIASCTSLPRRALVTYVTDCLSFDLVYVLEPLSNLAGCPVTTLILMGIQDDVFLHVKTLDQLYKLMVNAKDPIRLTINPLYAKTPVMRAYEHRSRSTVSPTKAMTYDALYVQLKSLSLKAGFERRCIIFRAENDDDLRIDFVTPYCLRRMAANELDQASGVRTAQRKQVLGHKPDSEMFVSSHRTTNAYLFLIHAYRRVMNPQFYKWTSPVWHKVESSP
jgi:hypothetical protein